MSVYVCEEDKNFRAKEKDMWEEIVLSHRFVHIAYVNTDVGFEF
jgi:hypothetical protein